MMHTGETRQRLNQIVTILKKEYTNPRIALEFSNPLELLIAAILAAQCTDVRVNQVTSVLFKKYRSAKEYASTPLNTLEQDIKQITFFGTKAKNIQRCCQLLTERHHGQVPNTMAALVGLPGVGRKTANMVLGSAFGIPGIDVDTHVRRLSQRMGFSKHDDPDKIEQDLAELVPQAEWTSFSYLLIDHGRATCKAPTPFCDRCQVNRLCPSSTAGQRK